MLEPTLVRRILTGILLACLMLGAGALGWLRAAGGRRAREVDLPAVGGVLVEDGSSPAVSERSAVARAPSSRPPQPAAVRQTARAAVPSRGGGRTDPVHLVQQGETLYRIARRYGVKVDDLQKGNGLASDLIRVGQVLVVPGGTGQGSAISLEGVYAWPVLAPVSSGFGQRWGRPHEGIDLAANHGDEIQASRDGTVEIAGTVPGYGETVILEHADGSRTLYGHCSKLLVKPGQAVRQGEVIALVGSTGQSTGPHLHFEIILNDQPIDPIKLLPKR